MQYKTRAGETVEANERQDRVLAALYGHIAGRVLLKLLTRPWVSRLVVAVLNTRLSGLLVVPFVERHRICISDYAEDSFSSYNAFFTRRIRPEKRPICMEKGALISPCDAKLSVCPIERHGSVFLKHSRYTMAGLVRDAELARRYEGGTMLIFRLTVDDYHHYCYPADGERGETVRIPGVLHTVNPLAGRYVRVYKENAREYCTIRTKEFGEVLMMEVGALCVGRIVNPDGQGLVLKGTEKGHFEFGGSTVVLCFEKGTICVDADIVANSRDGIETIVRYGERVGRASEGGRSAK